MAFDTKSQMRIATTVIRSEQEAIQRSRSQKQARGYNAVPQPLLGIASDKISPSTFGQVALADGSGGLADADLTTSTESISAYNPTTEEIAKDSRVAVIPVVVKNAQQVVWRIVSETAAPSSGGFSFDRIWGRIDRNVATYSDDQTDLVIPIEYAHRTGSPGLTYDSDDKNLLCTNNGVFWCKIAATWGAVESSGTHDFTLHFNVAMEWWDESEETWAVFGNNIAGTITNAKRYTNPGETGVSTSTTGSYWPIELETADRIRLILPTVQAAYDNADGSTGGKTVSIIPMGGGIEIVNDPHNTMWDILT